MCKALTFRLAIGFNAWAQAPRPKTGPAVGEAVPVFSATDQTGRTQTLTSLMGAKGTMLVFFRSADWWPYCKGQLVELQSNLEKLRAEGLGVAGSATIP